MMQHDRMTGTPVATGGRDRFEDRMRRIAAKNLKEASMTITENHPELARWYCLQVMKGHEFSVENELQAANVEVFMPREKTMQVRHGRRIECELPFFPGYLLVRFVPSAHAFQGMRRQRNVVGIIGGGDGRYHVIRDEVVKAFKRIGEMGMPRMATDKSFKDGDKADIVDGPFSGFLCVVVAVKWSRQARARVVIDMQGRSFEIDSMPLAFLKKL